MIAVDTNVLVRLLTGDEPEQAAAARRLFASEAIWIGKTVLLETGWVLRGLSSPKARLCSAQEVLSPRRRLACQLFELGDPHFSISEHRADLEPAAHSFDVFGQGTDTDVGSVLNLRDLSLRFARPSARGAT